MLISRRMRWAGMWHAWRKNGMHARFLVGEPERETDHFEDIEVGGKIIIKWILDK
jgi:hypothetical protein